MQGGVVGGWGGMGKPAAWYSWWLSSSRDPLPSVRTAEQFIELKKLWRLLN